MPHRPLAKFRVNLKEIPTDGRAYLFDRASAELDLILADLIDDRPYRVDLVIKPLGNAYEVAGKVETATPQVCSRCGVDIDVPLVREVRDFLIEDEDEFRNAQSVHGNGAVDFLNDEAAAATYQGGVFDLGEYVHETIALAEPFYPACPSGTCPNIEAIERKRFELEQSFQQADDGVGHPGFATLKNLKV